MKQFYIRNKNAGFLGNSPVWYGKDGRGYTAYITGAHRFDEAHAQKMVANDPKKYEMLDCAEVDKRLHLVFDWQDKCRLGTDAPCGWPSGYAPNPSRQTEIIAALENAVRAFLDVPSIRTMQDAGPGYGEGWRSDELNNAVDAGDYALSLLPQAGA